MASKLLCGAHACARKRPCMYAAGFAQIVFNLTLLRIPPVMELDNKTHQQVTSLAKKQNNLQHLLWTVLRRTVISKSRRRLENPLFETTQLRKRFCASWHCLLN